MRPYARTHKRASEQARPGPETRTGREEGGIPGPGTGREEGIPAFKNMAPTLAPENRQTLSIKLLSYTQTQRPDREAPGSGKVVLFCVYVRASRLGFFSDPVVLKICASSLPCLDTLRDPRRAYLLEDY